MTVEEDARKRCPEWLCDWRKVPESDDRSVLVTVEEGAGKRCSGRVTVEEGAGKLCLDCAQRAPPT